ncbi:unnamed protein product [Ascophyllum nodosum]
MRPIPSTPKKRFGLEIARFAIYLTIPVVAITVCSDPKNMEMFLRGFNFVEYPPESKKLPSADEIVKMMEQRKSKRLSAQVDATRAALDARLGTRSEATVDANAPPEPQQQRAEELATHQGLTAPLKKTSGWLTWLWRGGDSRDDPSDTGIPK